MRVFSLFTELLAVKKAGVPELLFALQHNGSAKACSYLATWSITRHSFIVLYCEILDSSRFVNSKKKNHLLRASPPY
jgi:hypothetical protein